MFHRLLHTPPFLFPFTERLAACSRAKLPHPNHYQYQQLAAHDSRCCHDDGTIWPDESEAEAAETERVVEDGSKTLLYIGHCTAPERVHSH